MDPDVSDHGHPVFDERFIVGTPQDLVPLFPMDIIDSLGRAHAPARIACHDIRLQLQFS